MTNQKIADIFEEMGIILDMMGVQWKPRAYEKAANEIRALSEDLEEIYKRGGIKALNEIPSIGVAFAKKIEEFIKIGRIKEYEKLKEKYPVRALELSKIEGVGPRMIRDLFQALNVRTIRQLEAVAKDGKIQNLPRFGKKTEEQILRSISLFNQNGDRKILGYIFPLAKLIEERLKRLDEVKKISLAGSLRRKEETIGDIDILVVSEKAEKVHEVFTKMPEVVAIHEKGKTRSSVRLHNGMDADLRVVKEESFGAAFQYFTGNKAHNVELRKIAVSKKMKLNEYGLWKGKKRIAGETEEEIYEKLGLDWIEPELRTNSGEIEAAKKHALPKILSYHSLRGDLQVQSNWTDGMNSLEELVVSAMAYGLEYIAITDHTKDLKVAGGLDEKKIQKQWKEIDKLNARFKKQKKNFQILKGSEINILEDGGLDLPDSILRKLEVVGVAVHSHMKMDRFHMTKRILRAISNPFVHILFHPTGRKIHARPPYDIDMEEIIKAAKKYRVALEIDAYPDRSDLHSTHARMALEAGVKLTIDSDSHARGHFEFLKLGEAIARRAWATKKDILNTLPVDKLLQHFKKKL